MKLTIKLIVAVIVIYLVFAFIKADFNAFEWTADARAGMVYVCFVTAFGLIAIHLMYNDEI